jgi:hypothetical protein
MNVIQVQIWTLKTQKHYLFVIVANHYQGGWGIFLQINRHCPPSWPSSPTMKSNTPVMGMSATSTRQWPCCTWMCQMTTSHNKSSWLKGPFGGVWTTFSNAYNSTWWPCSYKCNFPSMFSKTIVKYINFYAPYIQICNNEHTMC